MVGAVSTEAQGSMAFDQTPDPFFEFLVDNGYKDVRQLDEGRYAAGLPLLNNHAIAVGRLGDTIGYQDRWCYSGDKAAKDALEAWDGQGEPEGWHRHPASGRRREYDEVASRLLGEYVHF